jgi:hypothetical protein
LKKMGMLGAYLGTEYGDTHLRSQGAESDEKGVLQSNGQGHLDLSQGIGKSLAVTFKANRKGWGRFTDENRGKAWEAILSDSLKTGGHIDYGEIERCKCTDKGE